MARRKSSNNDISAREARRLKHEQRALERLLLQNYEHAAERQHNDIQHALLLRAARDDLIAFAKAMMPDPEGEVTGETWRSRYKPQPHHRYLADLLEQIARGTAKRHLAISMPPQTGKTQLASIFFIAWFHGHHPRKHIIFATYNEDRAREVAVEVRKVMESQPYKIVFPDYAIRADRRAADEFSSTEGGNVSFLGRGGSGTGKAADLVIIDDPIKNREEALSPSVLRELHEWYAYVIESRCHVGTRQIIIQTRWATDDLIGRLCDPAHPEHDPELAAYWKYVNIPAILRDDDVCRALGKKPGEALWPEKFPLDLLERKRRLNPTAFEALYQGNPTPDDGSFFTNSIIQTYNSPDELPSQLEFYGASDHALSEKQEGDRACLGCVGVDPQGRVWVLPDLVWDRLGPSGLVDYVIAQMERHRPRVWFGEEDMIGRALGPVLRQRMRERGIYTSLQAMPPIGSKQARAANIQAMMALGLVRFPAFAPWWQAARMELLKFPAYRHDDFVDFIGLIGRGLDWLRGGRGLRTPEKEIVPWTGAWLLREMRRARGEEGKVRHYCSL